MIIVLSIILHKVYPQYAIWEYTLLGGTWFWLLFDYVLNLLLGNNVFYLGTSSATDEKLREVPVLMLLFIKVWMFLLGIGLFYHLDWVFYKWRQVW